MIIGPGGYLEKRNGTRNIFLPRASNGGHCCQVNINVLMLSKKYYGKRVKIKVLIEEVDGDNMDEKNDIENKVYSGWAYTKDEAKKGKINRDIYDDIKNKSKIIRVSVGYGNVKYKVLENNNNLSQDELALICDSGNLCFGYRMENELIVIHSD